MTVDTHIGSQASDGDQTLSGAEVIVAALESFGIEVVFGLCGHTNLAMLSALEKSSIRFIGVRHEQVAAHAADGYFRACHKPAGVLTTIGPGLTNALTGVGDAAMDSAAMVIIAGDVPSYLIGKDAFQELTLHGEAQQVDIARPLVKRAWRVAQRDVLAHDVIRACSFSVSGNPGPVLLDVPLDFFSEVRTEKPVSVVGRLLTQQRMPAPQEAITAAAELIGSSERLVIYTGGGAVLSEAQAQITELAEFLGAPVVSTLSGQGAISQDHELYAGYTATVGTPVAHELVNTADVVLVLGSQLGEMETSSYHPDISFRVPPTRLIQVDIRATEIGKNYPVAVGIQADIGTAIDQLLGELKQTLSPVEWTTSRRFRDWRGRVDAWNQEIAECATSDEQPIVVERLLKDLRSALPRDGIFLTDVGIRHQVAQQFPVYAPMTHYVGSGWGTMGGAVGAALGAKVARPDAAVVAEVGDGAFSSVLSAVVTAVEHNLGVVWVVMNNYGYSSISVYQAKHDLGSLGTSFASPDGTPYNPDFAKFAEACGAQGRVVTDPADLLPTLQEAIESGGPWVLDVHTERAPRTRASGFWDVNDVLSGARLR
jgi:acetolactate synthase-1/2/3 large subunit